MNKHLFFLFACAILLLTCQPIPKTISATNETLIEDVVLTAEDFVAVGGGDTTVGTEGLLPEGDSLSSTFLSQPVPAPFPFNALVPQWHADVPENAEMELWVRTRGPDESWSAWHDIHASMDWTRPEDEDLVGEMIVVPVVDLRHDAAQYMIVFEREDAAAVPVLQELRLTFIDSTSGPTTAELVEQQAALRAEERQQPGATAETADGYPKPAVISRDVWCTHDACDYTEGLSYQPVTHLVVHHTVSGSDGDSAALVRAIWNFHTYTRGWGDIGYNYLIDVDGFIFEGHLGGDDVVGTHAAGANAGSMGTALIGSFSAAEPPAAMLESAIDMLAWKASQRNIDVYGASRTLPDIEWGLPNLMGHRDVYGTTECPGSLAHALLPTIRQAVAERIGLVSPHTYVDELSPAFIKSQANWYNPVYNCGHNGHSWFTYSTTDPAEAVNWGEWRPDVPRAGRYAVEAYVPYCNTSRPETTGATYTITHADGSDTVVVDQDKDVGLWIPLGEYNFHAGTAGVIHLTDLTTTDDGNGIWFDALRLLPLQVQPRAQTVLPAPGMWLKEREVTFNWTIENPEVVSETTLQVATDPNFINLLYSETFAGAVTQQSHIFNGDYTGLHWRVLLASETGDTFASPTIAFGIDTTPPTSKITALYHLVWSDTYRLEWTAEDNLAGVAVFNLDYRNIERAEWTRWLSDTSSRGARFMPPEPGKVYGFRVQASDLLGNLEPAHEVADVTTLEAIALPHAIMLPTIYGK